MEHQKKEKRARVNEDEFGQEVVKDRDLEGQKISKLHEGREKARVTIP